MKKRAFRALALLLMVCTLPAIGWVSVNNTSLSFFEDNRDTSTLAIPARLSAIQVFDNYIDSVFQKADLASSGLDKGVFRKAMVGYFNFKRNSLLSTERQILSIIDFTQKSTQKRLWIVDLASNKLLFNTLVAHGQGSGMDMATNFSNLANSHQSSLGFYITSETYFGKHGLSMRLEGMDKGFNTNARDRAVVVHGADYVSQSFINQHGRLGRSHGCPALPVELTSTIIKTIKGQTCLFINGPSGTYQSDFLNQDIAAANFNKGSFIARASI